MSEGVITNLSFALIVQNSFPHKRVCTTNKPFISIHSRYSATSSAQPVFFLPAYQPVALLIITNPPCDDVTWGDLCLPILVFSFPFTPGTTKYFRGRSASIPSRALPAAYFFDYVVDRSKSVLGLLQPCLFRNFLKFGVEHLCLTSFNRARAPAVLVSLYVNIYVNLVYCTTRKGFLCSRTFPDIR
jgi:hypothetical protein